LCPCIYLKIYFLPPPWCQFHQHFTRTFFADVFAAKIFKPKTQLCNFWSQNISAKSARKMLMKSTPSFEFNPTIIADALKPASIGALKGQVIAQMQSWFLAKKYIDHKVLN